MKELPEKLGEKNYFDLNDSVRGLILVDTVNEILDYLESQKEGEEPFIQHGGHLYDKTGNEVCCEKAKEEPKQIEEVFWKGYSKGVDVQIEKDYLSKEQLEEIKRALQQ